jgi:hypothetical protein
MGKLDQGSFITPKRDNLHQCKQIKPFVKQSWADCSPKGQFQMQAIPNFSKDTLLFINNSVEIPKEETREQLPSQLSSSKGILLPFLTCHLLLTLAADVSTL